MDDLSMLGSAPDLPFLPLNLAGVDGAPDPSTLAHPDYSLKLITPDFQVPDGAAPGLVAGNLAAAELTFLPEFQPDPLQPDLMHVPQPAALDFYDNDLMPPLPCIAVDIPSDADIQASMEPGYGFPGLMVMHGDTEVDPPLPDLQSPQLTQDVVMRPEDRPGELDPDVLSILHSDPDYAGVRDRSYQTNTMDQRGNNSKRARKMTQLEGGMAAEESGGSFF